MSDALGALLGSIAGDGGRYRVTVPDGWMQGRTTYGGLSAALALDVTKRDFSDLPPLRSAQIAFIGPLAGEIELRTELLRRGRTAAYVQCDLLADEKLGLRALLVFMHAQDSHVALPPPVLETVPGRGERFEVPATVRFAGQFEIVKAIQPRTRRASITRWARLSERDGVPADVALIAIADMLPPAAMTLFERQGPISSMTWQVNILADPIETEDGWWLLSADADSAQHGSSSQGMTIRNSAGLMVASGMQSVALFV